MDGSDQSTEILATHLSEQLTPQTHHASKKRKVDQKTVVTVKIGAKDGKQRSEGPPSDCWSWRKYGQKPIKGSPYPRGYYRCSTSKGCSAKKQVERCRTNSSMLIITYTSSHNHPDPHLPTTNQYPTQQRTTKQHQTPPPTPTEEEEEEEEEDEDPKQEKIQEQQPLIINSSGDQKFHYSKSPLNSSQDIIIVNQEENPFTERLDIVYDSPSFLFDEQPLSYPHLMTFTTPKSQEYDFYDELEELPSSSFFSSNFFEEWILVHPS